MSNFLVKKYSDNILAIYPYYLITPDSNTKR